MPEEVGELLRAHGHDASTVFEQRLGGADDERVGEVCRIEGRSLLTLDLGFADIRAHPPAEYRGLIVLRLRTQGRSHLLAQVMKLAPLLTAQELDRRLWIVDETGIRIRE